MEVGSEAPKQQVLSSNDELCRFLLGDTGNAQRLSGQDLATEVDIVGVRANRGVDGVAKELLEEALRKKAEAAKEKYHLNDDDAVAFEQLLTGFSQSSLEMDRPMGSSEFAVNVSPGERTLWDMEEGNSDNYPTTDAQQNGKEYLAFRKPNTQELAAYDLQLGELDMTPPARIQTMQASPALMGAVLGEFNKTAVVEGQDRQIRKSPDHALQYTVIQAPKALSDRQPTEFYAVPIHRVGHLKK